MRKAIIFAAGWALLVPGSALAQVNAAASRPAASRNVSVEVRENGRVVAASTVRLQLGRPAAISMNGPYSMRLRVDAVEGAGYMVRPNLHAEGPTGYTALATAPVAVAQGQQGRAVVERPSGPPLELAIAVD
jgi:hypothetical protein